MITKQHSHYLKFLASGYHILLLSTKHYDSFDAIADSFSVAVQRVINEDEYDNLTTTLMNNKIDIVLLDFTEQRAEAKRFLEKIAAYESRIVVIAIMPRDLECDQIELLEDIDGILLEGFDIYKLKDKIFTQLSLFYTIKSIGRREYKIESGSLEADTDLDEFFDLYEGNTLFIVDELVALNKLMKNGELSKELLEQIAQKLEELAEIFSKNSKVADLEEIFTELALFLKKLDLNTIAPASLYAFDYICAIIDDTNEYVMDLFVDRVFKDIKLVQYSLKDNIIFMQNALGTVQKNATGELEFF